MYSGTLDAIVYDTVLEETGGGDGFEKRIGRVRAIESAALVASALAGGWLAGLTTTRTTYFLTIPFAARTVRAGLLLARVALAGRGTAGDTVDQPALAMAPVSP
jgi:hypothetical protein